MAIIFDLDYTLLDNERFQADFLQAIGTDMAGYSSFIEIEKKNGINYSLIRHLNYLLANQRIKSVDRCKTQANNFLRQIDDYLYPGVLVMLPQLTGHELYLVSYGDKAWQRMKIRYSSIKKYFRRMYFVDESKIPSLVQIEKRSPDLIIINDKASEIVEMQKELPNAKYYLVKSRYSHLHPTGLHPHSIGWILRNIKRTYG